jgi:NAD(P)-dependent dehydrogenase (short-subunit alcohol dehydrogenase family)
MTQWQNSIAAITGAGSGIGRALALGAAQFQPRLALADINTDALDATADEVRAMGVEVLAVPTDVSNAGEVQAFADATLERFGGVDIVVNNAGVSTFNLIEDQTLDDWRWVLDVNLFGVIHGVHAFLPILRRRGVGHVVNVASIAGVDSGIAFIGPYAASKVAVVSLSETLAIEMAGYHPGIHVSVVCPASTDTAIMRNEVVRPPSRGVERRTDDGERWRVGIEASLTGPTGRPASDVAAQIIEAVATDRFWVFTHADSVNIAGHRIEAVRAALESEAERVRALR